MSKGRRHLLNLFWLLLPAVTWGVFSRPAAERQMIADIDEGHVLAWSRHITGQDPNDMNDFDQFESVAVIPGRSARADGVTREDDEVWAVVRRDVNGVSVRYVEQFQPLDWGPDPNYCWFVDCAGGTPAVPAVPGTPAVPATYKMTYLSESNVLWGVPLGDRVGTCYLDAGVAARNVGGGIVGLPFTNHPFAAGDTVVIAGTSGYDGTRVLGAGTSANELQITISYNAETFDGTEVVVKRVSLSIANTGRTVRDSSGNFYYGHNYSSNTCITKILPDGTTDSTVFTWPAELEMTVNSTVGGMVFTADEAYLYVLLNAPNRVIKFDMATGTAAWTSDGILYIGYELGIDAQGNAYTSRNNGSPVIKLDAADGAITDLTSMGQEPHPAIASTIMYDIAVDDELGIVIGAGRMYCTKSQSDGVKALMYNLAVRTFDDSAGDTIRIGANYDTVLNTYTALVGTGCVVTDGEYIYALAFSSDLDPEVHKLQWDGSSLAEITSWTAPTYASGLFFDLYGNLVVVNQDATGAQDDVFYYYDTDGTALSTVTGIPGGLAKWWEAAVGGSWLQGDVHFDGELAIPEVPETPEVPATQVGPQLDGEYVCVYADGIPRGAVDPNTRLRARFLMDGNDVTDFNEADYSVIIAGLNYFSILETAPVGPLDRQVMIQDVQVNFHDSMGAHVGADRTNSADWQFSEDDFNTPIAPWSGYKGPAPFLRGTRRRPSVYLWEECPIPMTIRSIRADMEVTFE